MVGIRTTLLSGVLLLAACATQPPLDADLRARVIADFEQGNARTGDLIGRQYFRPQGLNVVGISETAKLVGSGTGFFVSAQGQILTNHHVVDGCSALRIPFRGQEIRAVHRTSDAANDLALLETDVSVTQFAKFRQGRGVRRAEDVFAIGYPLRGTALASQQMNVTKGNVSALSGPQDTFGLIQITAPVQAGNSGGPLLDTSGNIVGIVLGKANADRFAEVTGQLPENVNFAIKATTAREFLDAMDVAYGTKSSSSERSPADVAMEAGEFTVPVECWQSTASVDPSPTAISTTLDQPPSGQDRPILELLVGLMAYQEGDYKKAARIWEPLAVSGNDMAQLDMGLLYQRGLGVPQDNARAHALVSRAARQGNADAINMLIRLEAVMTRPELDRALAIEKPGQNTPHATETGTSTTIDQPPSRQDRPMGSLIEGLMAYQAGDYKKAAGIWKPLAEGGDVTAQYNMGLMYTRGSYS